MTTSTHGNVAHTNARTLVVQLRKLADESEGLQRTKLRDLAVKANTLADQIAEALAL